MTNPTKAIPIDSSGRVIVTNAGEIEVRAADFTVGDQTAVKLESTGSPSRRKLFVRNIDTANDRVVYIGDANVSTTNGLPLYELDEIELDVNENAEVWAIADGAGADVRILEIE